MKFGYYFAGGVKTYSKLEARQIGHTTFHFHDELFSSINTKEPDASLRSLYVKRAQQIREQYDHVVIMYSGGSDSHTVLDAFLEADCKIDEIVTFWDYPTTRKPLSFHNEEITIVAHPRLKQLQEAGVHFKHRAIDIAPLVYATFGRLKTDYEYHFNSFLSPNNTAKHFLRDHVKDWKDMIASGKRVVFVWGTEKPILSVDNGQWAFQFADRFDNCIAIHPKPGWFDETFFWTPDMPEIVIKQAHVVKRFCSTPSDEAWMWTDAVTDSGYNASMNKYLTYDALKCVIYPTWDKSIYCNGKGASLIYSARDAHFFAGNVGVDRFNQIVDSYYAQLNDKTPRDQRFSMSPMYTRKYHI
jgi:hypothetical protein